AHSGGFIDMGLERTRERKKRIKLEAQCPVGVVGGTKGKRSGWAHLTQNYKQEGYKIGTLAQPHLLRFKESHSLNTQTDFDGTI
ncbi:bifunctional folylpolyglutamate synthase/dihydrofolate synthase, partial [Neisseria meningitidis]